MPKRTAPTVSEIIEILRKNYRPDEPIACSLWSTQDVVDDCERCDRATPSAAQVDRILAEMHDSINNSSDARHCFDDCVSLVLN